MEDNSISNLDYLNKSEDELLVILFENWQIKVNNNEYLLVGCYEKAVLKDGEKPYGYFNNVQSLTGNLLFYPNKGSRVKIRCTHDDNYLKSPISFFEVKLARKDIREKHNSPFLLCISTARVQPSENPELTQKKKNIEHLHNVTYGAHPIAAGNQAAALKQFEIELYTKKERLIFELIQNADDFPNKETGLVDLKFVFLKDNIAILHNGQPFSNTDVTSICSIGNSSKSKDTSATGYKGIGFKSVFTHAKCVYVYSGGYSFKFDKFHENYLNFNLLYPNIDVQDEYKGREIEFANPDKIPWELMPIWVDKIHFPKEIYLYKDFFNSEVAFALEFGPVNVKQFKDTFKKLILEPRFLLFLRNINSINIQGLESISKVEILKNKNQCVLKINDAIKNSFIIPEEPIRIEIPLQKIEEFKKAEGVPPKLLDVGRFSLNFAIEINNDGRLQEVKDSIIFTYLPTEDRAYKFPFLVNSDFVTSSNRETILSENIWNKFVFEHLGFEIVKWAKSISESEFKYRYDFLAVIPSKFAISEDSIENSFNKGYDKAINEIAFIPNYEDKLCKLDEILIDNSGFFNLVGKNIFTVLTGITLDPIHTEIIYIEKLENLILTYRKGLSFSFKQLKDLVVNKVFQNWLIIPENNALFIRFLDSKNKLIEFSSEAIYLSNEKTLCKSSDIYLDLGDAAELLSWTNFQKILHPDVKNLIKDLTIPCKPFIASEFIKNVILGQNIDLYKKSIENQDNNKKFYLFLLSKLIVEDYPINLLKNMPVFSKQGLVQSWNFYFYKNSFEIENLLINNSLKKGTYYTISNPFSNDYTLANKWDILCEKLGVKTFDLAHPFDFIKINIADKISFINNYYAEKWPAENIDNKEDETYSKIKANAHLWQFLLVAFENLSPTHINELKPILQVFPILSKKFIFTELNKLYLPSEFTDDVSLEQLTVQFPSTDIEFITNEYLKFDFIDKGKTRKFFKDLGAKENSIDFIQHTLLPNLGELNQELFISLTKLIYDNRESDSLIKAVLSNQYFKLKTKEGTYLPINTCWIGTPYIDIAQVPILLDSVPLINQISDEYSDSQLSAWRNFFADKLKVHQLLNDSDVLSQKLKYINDNPEYSRLKSINLLKELYCLYKKGKLNITGTTQQILKSIPLLCFGSDDTFAQSNKIHFSTEYAPTFDFQKLFGSECGVLFLSNYYKFDDDKQLITFFEQLGVTQGFDANRHNSLIQNIPTLDGQKKPASQLYVSGLKKYVGENNISNIDLSGITLGGRNLEDYLGFIPKLNVYSILNYIHKKKPNKKELKELITELLSVYNNNKTDDRNALNSFISSAKLLSTTKIYNDVKNLFSIDDSISSGIQENEYLIDPLFSKSELEKRNKYLTHFSIKTLKIEDFNPHFDNEQFDCDFTNRVEERLVFLAYDTDNEKYLQLENEYKKKFQEWKIKSCAKISLKYPANESKIVKEDNRNFINVESKIIYYIGDWIEQRNYIIVYWLQNNILGIEKQLQFFQDLLLNNPNDIIKDIESKGRIVPNEIKQRFKSQNVSQIPLLDTEPPVQEPKKTTGEKGEPKSTLTNEEIDELKILFDSSFSGDQMYDENLVAHIKALFYYQHNGYDVSAAKIMFKENLKNKYLHPIIDNKGSRIKVLCRSGRKGVLYLGGYAFLELENENTELYILTGSSFAENKICKGVKDLDSTNADFWVLRRNVEDNSVDLHDMIKSVEGIGKLQLIYRVNSDDFKSIFESFSNSIPESSSGGVNTGDEW